MYAPLRWDTIPLSCAGLSSVEDTESILAKAIRDGGVEAVIDHQNGWMTSRDRVDVYSSGEPQSAFHARVAFCLDIHNEVCAWQCCYPWSPL